MSKPLIKDLIEEYLNHHPEQAIEIAEEFIEHAETCGKKAAQTSNGMSDEEIFGNALQLVSGGVTSLIGVTLPSDSGQAVSDTINFLNYFSTVLIQKGDEKKAEIHGLLVRGNKAAASAKVVSGDIFQNLAGTIENTITLLNKLK